MGSRAVFEGFRTVLRIFAQFVRIFGENFELFWRNLFVNYLVRDVHRELLVQVEELVGDLLEVLVDGDELVVDVE